MADTEANCQNLVKQAEKGAEEIMKQSRLQANTIVTNAMDDVNYKIERITSIKAQNQIV